jgi:hypothetical protein
MRPRTLAATGLVRLWTIVIFLLPATLRAAGGDFHLQAQLLWATEGEKAPEGKNYKPVDPAVAKKLKDIPLKWKNFFEVNRTNFVVTPAAVRTVAVSEKCRLEVSIKANSNLEVMLIGKGKEVFKRTQPLPVGEILAISGNSPNDTGWLVVLHQIAAGKK